MTDSDSNAAEQSVAAYFHHARSASKKKPNPGVEKIYRAVRERAIRDAGL